jgi:WD40 repeat protein
MTFTPDGKGLVAGGLDESSVDENGRVIIHPYVSVWDLATGKERRPFAFPKDVRGGWVVTPDGKSLIMTTRGVGVRVFDLETGKQTLTLRHEDPSDKDPGRIDYENSQVCSMTLSPDGKTLALGTRRQELLLCDLEKGEIRHKIQTNETSALTFAPDGKRLASATSGGHRVQVWDPANGTNLDVLRVGNAADGIDALAFSPDGKTLALGGRHSVDLWDFGMFGVRDDFAGGAGFCPGDSALLLAFSPDGKMLVTAGRKIPVGFWDVPAGAPKSVTQDTTPPTIPSPPRP